MGQPVTEVSATEVVGAGSVIEYSLDVNAPSWVVLTGVESIPQVGDESPSLDVAGIDETAPRYIPGYKENSDWELAMKQRVSDPDQSNFMDAAIDRANMLVRVTYSTGSRRQFMFTPLGDFASEASKTEPAMYAVKGRISGDITRDTVGTP